MWNYTNQKKIVSVLMIVALLMISICNGSGADSVHAAKKSKVSLKKQYEKKKKEADSNASTAKQLAKKIKKINLKIATAAGQIEVANQEIIEFDKKMETEQKSLLLSEDEQKTELAFVYECIRILYESGEFTDDFSALKQSESFMDYLNHKQYREEILAYVKERMATYEKIGDTVQKKKDGIKDYDKLKLDREEELIELEKKQEEFASQIADLSELVKMAKKKAKNAAAFAKDLEKEVALMEEQERKEMAKNSYDGSSSNVTNSGNGTKYYNVGAFEYTSSELTLMASIIEAEAGSTSYPNMIAVGSVIMNRVSSSKFPNTIEGVVYASGQFEPVRTGRLAAIMARGPAKNCIKAAKDVLNGKRNVHNFYFKAAWYAKQHGIKGVQIGDNVFH